MHTSRQCKLIDPIPPFVNRHARQHDPVRGAAGRAGHAQRRLALVRPYAYTYIPSNTHTTEAPQSDRNYRTYPNKHKRHSYMSYVMFAFIGLRKSVSRLKREAHPTKVRCHSNRLLCCWCLAAHFHRHGIGGRRSCSGRPLTNQPTNQPSDNQTKPHRTFTHTIRSWVRACSPCCSTLSCGSSSGTTPPSAAASSR